MCGCWDGGVKDIDDVVSVTLGVVGVSSGKWVCVCVFKHLILCKHTVLQQVV